MSVRNLITRIDKALDQLPQCVPGRARVLRSWRRYVDEPYQLRAPDDVCANCGVLGCGVEVIEEVEVTNNADGTLVDARGVEVVKT